MSLYICQNPENAHQQGQKLVQTLGDKMYRVVNCNKGTSWCRMLRVGERCMCGGQGSMGTLCTFRSTSL